MAPPSPVGQFNGKPYFINQCDPAVQNYSADGTAFPLTPERIEVLKAQVAEDKTALLAIKDKMGRMSQEEMQTYALSQSDADAAFNPAEGGGLVAAPNKPLQPTLWYGSKGLTKNPSIRLDGAVMRGTLGGVIPDGMICYLSAPDGSEIYVAPGKIFMDSAVYLARMHPLQLPGDLLRAFASAMQVPAPLQPGQVPRKSTNPQDPRLYQETSDTDKTLITATRIPLADPDGKDVKLTQTEAAYLMQVFKGLEKTKPVEKPWESFRPEPDGGLTPLGETITALPKNATDMANDNTFQSERSYYIDSDITREQLEAAAGEMIASAKNFGIERGALIASALNVAALKSRVGKARSPAEFLERFAPDMQQKIRERAEQLEKQAKDGANKKEWVVPMLIGKEAASSDNLKLRPLPTAVAAYLSLKLEEAHLNGLSLIKMENAPGEVSLAVDRTMDCTIGLWSSNSLDQASTVLGSLSATVNVKTEFGEAVAVNADLADKEIQTISAEQVNKVMMVSIIFGSLSVVAIAAAWMNRRIRGASSSAPERLVRFVRPQWIGSDGQLTDRVRQTQIVRRAEKIWGEIHREEVDQSGRPKIPDGLIGGDRRAQGLVFRWQDTQWKQCVDTAEAQQDMYDALQRADFKVDEDPTGKKHAVDVVRAEGGGALVDIGTLLMQDPQKEQAAFLHPDADSDPLTEPSQQIYKDAVAAYAAKAGTGPIDFTSKLWKDAVKVGLRNRAVSIGFSKENLIKLIRTQLIPDLVERAMLGKLPERVSLVPIRDLLLDLATTSMAGRGSATTLLTTERGGEGKTMGAHGEATGVAAARWAAWLDDANNRPKIVELFGLDAKASTVEQKKAIFAKFGLPATPENLPLIKAFVQLEATGFVMPNIELNIFDASAWQGAKQSGWQAVGMAVDAIQDDEHRLAQPFIDEMYRLFESDKPEDAATRGYLKTKLANQWNVMGAALAHEAEKIAVDPALATRLVVKPMPPPTAEQVAGFFIDRGKSATSSLFADPDAKVDLGEFVDQRHFIMEQADSIQFTEAAEHAMALWVHDDANKVKIGIAEDSGTGRAAKKFRAMVAATVVADIGQTLDPFADNYVEQLRSALRAHGQIDVADMVHIRNTMVAQRERSLQEHPRRALKARGEVVPERAPARSLRAAAGVPPPSIVDKTDLELLDEVTNATAELHQLTRTLTTALGQANTSAAGNANTFQAAAQPLLQSYVANTAPSVTRIGDGVRGLLELMEHTLGITITIPAEVIPQGPILNPVQRLTSANAAVRQAVSEFRGVLASLKSDVPTMTKAELVTETQAFFTAIAPHVYSVCGLHESLKSAQTRGTHATPPSTPPRAQASSTVFDHLKSLVTDDLHELLRRATVSAEQRPAGAGRLSTEEIEEIVQNHPTVDATELRAKLERVREWSGGKLELYGR